MTASCSRYNEIANCTIISPNIMRNTWDIIGWNIDNNEGFSIWNENISKLITINQTFYVIIARSLRELIIENNGGEATIVAKDIPTFNKIAISQETYNQLSLTEQTTLLARDNKSAITYSIQSNYEVTNGLYKTVENAYSYLNNYGAFTSQNDNDGPSYYFRGDIENNYVKFGTNSNSQPLYWRIIRINGDGTIRLLYNGTSTANWGNSVVLDKITYNHLNSDNAYVGYMYGTPNSDYASTHANINSSNIKNYLENWYQDNLAGNIFEQLIDQNAIFCGDRNIESGTGTGEVQTNYRGGGRKYRPTYQCLNVTTESGRSVGVPSTNDQYSKIGSSRGNQTLLSPIGLISIDEAIFAGHIHGGTFGHSDWLTVGVAYWTMNPSSFTYADDYTVPYTTVGARIPMVSANQALHDPATTAFTINVRPVINLITGVTATGNGTRENPYIINY